jgi:cysteine-rich repeat protein
MDIDSFMDQLDADREGRHGRRGAATGSYRAYVVARGDLGLELGRRERHSRLHDDTGTRRYRRQQAQPCPDHGPHDGLVADRTAREQKLCVPGPPRCRLYLHMRTSRRLRGVYVLAVFLQLEWGCTLEIYEQTLTLRICGNARIDPGEVCDDGNTVDGDGCSHDCKSNEACGNGVIDQATGEGCDDGNTVDGDGCSSNCESKETCGNGLVDRAAGEVCDTGGASPACDPDCTLPECGDGLVNAAAGEQCDDGLGNGANGDPCQMNCMLAP